MRKILAIDASPSPHWVGDGFHVRGMIQPGAYKAQLSPFIMLDYAAPEVFAPTTARRGVP